MTRHIDHATITLAKGQHDDACVNPQRCLFEWYNWLTRDQHTDECPPDVSPVLHRFGMELNDCLPDDRRQELVRYLPNGTSPLAGTRGDGKDEARSYLALDWLVRTYLPAFLDVAGQDSVTVRSLGPIVDMASAEAAGPVVRAAWNVAAAARDAAWTAAGAATWDAAGAAARDAAGAAARDAARAAVGDAVGDAAADAARAAARAATGAAARAAAWDAAGAAARVKLALIVTELQTSAIDLYDRMVTP
jgi:hypothetical protein